jgi:Glycosyl hydrolase family 115/Gylcosyl hydrolase family 115 C-terminal domain
MLTKSRVALLLTLSSLFSLNLISASAQSRVPISETFHSRDFKLVFDGNAAGLCIDSNDFKVVQMAADDFASDVERVSGIKPHVNQTGTPTSPSAVFIGTLGHCGLIDRLVADKKIDARAIRGQWESYLVATVTDPLPGVKSGLVIAGSDRRGTAYGVFDLSEAIGVSPWYWWADVPAQHHQTLVVPAGVYTEGPPAVKYRGIFINDEDWGIQPWAAKTFDPQTRDIGPKTYAKVFELLLRLHANYLWPAMHNVTKAFNYFPDDKVVADDYAIVMGSSHCEPMLRNNVGEWPTNRAADWNYQKNPDEIKRYWEERVKENGKYENVYTLGMRGVHDGPLQATGTPQEKVQLMERIFADQRDLLAKWVNPEVTQVPQAFVPYKEVLQIYRDGLEVPDDVTLVWVDDNHGYIRELPNPQEQKRKGSSGIYYHVSYWGGPRDYLWLCSTPPGLIGEEMGKALDYNARTLWVLNVGDIKPAEIDIDYFLQLARDGRVVSQPDFLKDWCRRNFGGIYADDFAKIMAEYYVLNEAVKPEHLLMATFNDAEIANRLARFKALMDKTDELYAKMPAQFRDAFYELVVYPVRGSALANEIILDTQRNHEAASQKNPAANVYADEATKAYEGVQAETAYYNDQLAGGKWKYMMSDAPHDLRVNVPPNVTRMTNVSEAANKAISEDTATEPPARANFRQSAFIENSGYVSMDAAHFTRSVSRNGAAWRVVDGLGRSGEALTVFPDNTASVTNPAELAAHAPCLQYEFKTTSTGPAKITVYCVPVHRLYPVRGAHYAVAIDDEPPHVVDIESEENSWIWEANVLRAAALGESTSEVPKPGRHTLRLWMVDPGVPVDKIVIDFGGAKKSYFGPPETPATR